MKLSQIYPEMDKLDYFKVVKISLDVFSASCLYAIELIDQNKSTTFILENHGIREKLTGSYVSLCVATK